LVSGVTGISSFSATKGIISTGAATGPTPTGMWDITAIPFTDGSGVTTYIFPDTAITLTTTTSGGITYTTNLNVSFIHVK
jgi:hypothetical protein